MLHYIKLDVRHLFKEERFLVTLLICVQILSTLLIFFSYGAINHFNTKSEEVEGTSLHLGFERTGEEGISLDAVRNFYRIILPVIEMKLDYFFVMGESDGILVSASTGYQDGNYTVSRQLKENTELVAGRIFTEEEANSGEQVVLASGDLVPSGDMLLLDGEEYRVVGILESTMGPENYTFFPYNAIPDGSELTYTSFYLTKPLLQSEYNVIAEAARKCFQGMLSIPEFDGINNQNDYRVYQSIIFVLVVFIIICAINYCIIYRYLLEKRKRMFAVSRICGCSRGKAVVIYMIELLSASVVLLGIGCLIFAVLILPQMDFLFEYMKYYFDASVYLELCGIYVAVLFVTYLILVCRFVAKTPVELIREV